MQFQEAIWIIALTVHGLGITSLFDKWGNPFACVWDGLRWRTIGEPPCSPVLSLGIWVEASYCLQIGNSYVSLEPPSIALLNLGIWTSEASCC